MWLFNSSIGRKVVMSVTGVALILFLTFHCCMNIVALFSGHAYNAICKLLGANWYAVAATLALAALAVIHIVYAFILTAQNRRARGNNRYEVSTTVNGGKVEWASKNMLVLGIIILLGLLLHLFNFWYNMMFAELFPCLHHDPAPANGFMKIVHAFSNPVYVVLYIIWLVALWFHLTHGFWSAMQTLGWNGKVWFKRWKTIGNIFVTLLIAGFMIVVLAFAFKCTPSICKAKAAKAKKEMLMQKKGHCGKAHKDCMMEKAACDKMHEKSMGEKKECKCTDCKCDPCKCSEKEGCKCDPCKCEDCKC